MALRLLAGAERAQLRAAAVLLKTRRQQRQTPVFAGKRSLRQCHVGTAAGRCATHWERAPNAGAPCRRARRSVLFLPRVRRGRGGPERLWSLSVLGESAAEGTLACSRGPAPARNWAHRRGGCSVLVAHNRRARTRHGSFYAPRCGFASAACEKTWGAVRAAPSRPAHCVPLSAAGPASCCMTGAACSPASASTSASWGWLRTLAASAPCPGAGLLGGLTSSAARVGLSIGVHDAADRRHVTRVKQELVNEVPRIAAYAVVHSRRLQKPRVWTSHSKHEPAPPATAERCMRAAQRVAARGFDLRGIRVNTSCTKPGK
jgi:hypothetical protein